MAFSVNLFTTFLDILLNGGYHITLFTTLPTDANNTNGVEVTGGSFARVPVDPAFPVASGNTTTNSRGFTQLASNANLTFPTATASWGTIVGFGFMSALTGGSCLGAFAITETPVDALYSQTGNTVTVTSNGHGLTTSDKVDVRFFNTAGAWGVYQITAVTTNTFTYTASNSQTVTNAEIRYGKTKSITISQNDSAVFLSGQFNVAIKG